MMKTFKCMCKACIITLLSIGIFSCAPATAPPPSAAQAANTPQMKALPEDGKAMKSSPTRLPMASSDDDSPMPIRYQKPSYQVTRKGVTDELGKTKDDFKVLVGADISSKTGAVPLRDILKRLAALKNMNVSWSSDVDQYVLVDVDIRAEDDFFSAIENILRQQDYFHDVQGNSIVVKYKETKKFHIAMPFISSTYDMSVGGDVLGGSDASGAMTGNIKLSSAGNKFDIWQNIQANLDKVLQIWSDSSAMSTAPSPSTTSSGGDTAPAPVRASAPRVAQGYYTIDRPIGLITVTAPRSLLIKITSYLDNLKKELYKQIAIEA
ncbi:MAG: toxin co-regulated pilus biosynthesis Q family protein, partial [Proteobacteria bacterium]|nr:toxin co-regulated pilus biosynthesis Q family protein [Pseudomonadota bacterium]MBU1709111.1 toxin co-regulated pilus biosynthesis Q family protein [Pseudomonadota bacterium]